MGIMLPKKLATTMGVELTYVPKVCNTLARMGHPGLHGASEMLRVFMSAMKRQLDNAGISVHKCDVDPGCVEIPTLPHDSSYKLMRDISRITKLAKKTEMVPRPDYFIGGGAHVHAGVPFEDRKERRLFAKAMLVFAHNNPWIADAFRGINDTMNAERVAKGRILHVSNLDSTQKGIKAYNGRLAEYSRIRDEAITRLHTAEVWGSVFRRDAVQGDANYYAKLCVQTKKEISGRRKILARLQDNIPPTYSDILLKHSKGQAVSYRGDTVEFRCFLMQHDMRTFSRYIALVNAIVEHVHTAVESGRITGDTEAVLIDDKDYTWREQRDGFNNMLSSLGLDPEDYREDRIMLALRIRYNRTH